MLRSTNSLCRIGRKVPPLYRCSPAAPRRVFHVSAVIGLSPREARQLVSQAQALVDMGSPGLALPHLHEVLTCPHNIKIAPRILQAGLESALYEEKDAELALLLHSALSQRGVPADEADISSLLLLLYNTGATDAALQLIETLVAAGTAMSQRVVSSAVHVAAAARSADEAMRVLTLAIEAGTPLSRGIVHPLLVAATDEGRVDIVAATLDLMRQHGVAPSTKTYGIAIRAYLGSGLIDEALELYKEFSELPLAQRKSEEGLNVYSMLIRKACEAGSVDVALNFLDALSDVMGGAIPVQPLLSLVPSLIAGDDSHKAFRLLSATLAQPGIFVLDEEQIKMLYSVRLEQVENQARAQKLEQAVDMLATVDAHHDESSASESEEDEEEEEEGEGAETELGGPEENAEVYTTSEYKEFVSQCLVPGPGPRREFLSSQVCADIVKAFAASGRTDLAFRFASLVSHRALSTQSKIARRLQKWKPAKAPASEALVDKSAFLWSRGSLESLLLGGTHPAQSAPMLEAAGYDELVEGAIAEGGTVGAARGAGIVQGLHAAGITLSPNTYRRAIAALVRIGSVKDAEALLGAMKDAGIQSDDVLLSAMLRGYMDAGLVPELAADASEDLLPSASPYMTLEQVIQRLVEAGHIEEAVHMLEARASGGADSFVAPFQELMRGLADSVFKVTQTWFSAHSSSLKESKWATISRNLLWMANILDLLQPPQQQLPEVQAAVGDAIIVCAVCRSWAQLPCTEHETAARRSALFAADSIEKHAFTSNSFSIPAEQSPTYVEALAKSFLLTDDLEGLQALINLLEAGALEVSIPARTILMEACLQSNRLHDMARIMATFSLPPPLARHRSSLMSKQLHMEATDSARSAARTLEKLLSKQETQPRTPQVHPYDAATVRVATLGLMQCLPNAEFTEILQQAESLSDEEFSTGVGQALAYACFHDLDRGRKFLRSSGRRLLDATVQEACRIFLTENGTLEKVEALDVICRQARKANSSRVAKPLNHVALTVLKRSLDSDSMTVTALRVFTAAAEAGIRVELKVLEAALRSILAVFPRRQDSLGVQQPLQDPLRTVLAEGIAAVHQGLRNREDGGAPNLWRQLLMCAILGSTSTLAEGIANDMALRNIRVPLSSGVQLHMHEFPAATQKRIEQVVVQG